MTLKEWYLTPAGIEKRRKLSAYNRNRVNPMLGKRNNSVSKRMSVDNPSTHPGIRERLSKYMKNANKSEKARAARSKYMLNGGSSHSNSFIRNPSKPQVKLYEWVRSIYPDSILNYPCLNYCIDIAIPSLMIAIEYDCPYWHRSEEKDRKRQINLEKLRWKFIRYKNLPSETEFLNYIKSFKRRPKNEVCNYT